MLFKYLIIGGGNTLLTLGIIWTLMQLGLGVYSSNATAYIIGIIISFILNSLITFQKKLSWYNLFRFLTVCGICYMLNVMVIYLVLSISPTMIYIAQLLGMAIYTITGFLLNKFWAIK